MKYKIATPERVREWKARRKFIQENDVKASVFMKCHKFVKTAEASKRAASAATSASDFAVRIAASAMRSYVIFVHLYLFVCMVHAHTHLSDLFDWTKKIRQNTGPERKIFRGVTKSRKEEEWTREWKAQRELDLRSSEIYTERKVSFCSESK